MWSVAGGGSDGSRAAGRQLPADGDDGEGGDGMCDDGGSGGRGSRRVGREDEQWLGRSGTDSHS